MGTFTVCCVHPAVYATKPGMMVHFLEFYIAKYALSAHNLYYKVAKTERLILTIQQV